MLSLSAWDNHHDVGDTISATPNHQNRDAKNSLANSDGGGRKIEVHQNWLARLFRVKPATRYLCLTVPRRRARQEVAHLLREWRKYGIKDVEVDRSRDLVFARLDAKNCTFNPPGFPSFPALPCPFYSIFFSKPSFPVLD